MMHHYVLATVLGAALLLPAFPMGIAAAAPIVAWAWCGVHPDDPHAAEAVKSLRIAHVDATFGPCMEPDRSTYTPANPGRRYVDPATYRRLVDLNASVGMQTVVYDPRVWSDNPGTRLNALVYWKDRLPWIAAWDMGDEFDTGEWQTLIARSSLVLRTNTPWTSVRPYTNHLPFTRILDRALIDLGNDSLSFDDYNLREALWLARIYNAKTAQLTVAVSALDSGQGAPSPETIRETMHLLREAGADRFLIFGGGYPYTLDLQPDPMFGGRSLIDTQGQPTSWALAVLEGSL